MMLHSIGSGKGMPWCLKKLGSLRIPEKDPDLWKGVWVPQNDAGFLRGNSDS